MPGIALEIKRKCKVCGKVFLVKKLDSQFCSKRCSAVDLKRRRDAEVREARLAKIAAQVPDIREYISVREAVAMYHIERGTLYRLIRLGRIPAMNFGPIAHFAGCDHVQIPILTRVSRVSNVSEHKSMVEIAQ